MLSSQGRLLRLFLHVSEALLAISAGVMLITASWHPSPGMLVMVGLGGLARVSRGILDLDWFARRGYPLAGRRLVLWFLVALGFAVISFVFVYLLWPNALILVLVWLIWMLAQGLELLRWILETAFYELLTTGHGSAYWLVETAPQRQSRRSQRP